ncbi:MAG: rhomboid family intramembrane serine protease, partial [Spirochaetota bacterium]
ARIYLFGILPIQAPVLVILFTAVAIFSQLGSVRTGIAHLTHLAGFAFAFLYLLIRLGINPITQWRSPRRGPWR